MRKPLLCVVAILGIAAACGGGSSSVDPLKYNRTCHSARDCIAIATDACCGCLSAAISASDQTEYEADFAAAKKNCGETACGKECIAYGAGCLGGVCVITQPPIPDAGTD